MLMNNKYRNNRFSLVVTLAFVAVLFLPLSNNMFRYFKEPESIEKRKLYEFPKLESKTVDGFAKYARSFEWFFNDHFGFRQVLIRINSLFHYHVLHTSPKEMVITGKKGWLYYNSPTEGKSLCDYYGLVNFTKGETERIHQRLDTLKARLDSLNIPVLIAFIPNKHSVYPEYLPFNYSPARAPHTRENQIDSLLKLTNIKYINLHPILQKSKSVYPYPLYSQTDSHWNELGAYIGYRNIMNLVQPMFPKLKTYSLADYSIGVRRAPIDGDLANLIFMTGKLNDTDIKLTPKFKTQASRLPQSDSPAVEYVKKDSKEPVILMIHDSFTLLMRPLIAESFSHSIFVWSKNVDMNLVKKHHPDVIVIEFVERYSDLLLNI
jgi:hypothetical protein